MMGDAVGAPTPDGMAEPTKQGFILGIGASGAETASLGELLIALRPESDLAVVVVLRDREVLDEAAFRDSLRALSAALETPGDGEPVLPGRIYLAAANLILTIEEGRFRTRSAEGAPGERGTMDSFFVSLAGDSDGDSMAIILAGAAGDGTLGLATIKEGGGLAIAERTGEAGPPAGNPETLADFILPVAEMPERIASHVRHHRRLHESGMRHMRFSDEAEQLARIAAVLRDRTGHDFHGYKRATFTRRVQRRMQVAQTPTLGSYIEVLRSEPDEAQLLFNDLLIGVTQFFRDRREFDYLEAQVVPRMFEGKARADQLRVWVLGCSTGEEAYSIAILLLEYASRLETPPQIQVFASDIDGRALAVARVGRYPASIAKDVGPERIARWFVEEGDTYCIAKEVREACIFSQHSIVKDPPFSRLDLVSCRNLLIYLSAELQSRVIPLFHFALKRDGFLFLGNAENVSRHAELFAPLDRAYRIFRKLEAATGVLPDFPFASAVRTPTPPLPSPRPAQTDDDLGHRADRIAELYAPAYAVVNTAFDVLHFSPKAGRFIHPSGGAATLNLLNLVHADLRLDLRAALTRAASDGAAAEAKSIWMHDGGRRITVNLAVEPLQESDAVSRALVVIFQEEAAPEEGAATVAGDDGHVRRLEGELRITRERLQTMVEELQSTNEELKSSNEEYQSLNEELQSANEELQTSKEELQSVNEEVTTVNGELAHRVQELSRANSDLKNLLESTQIATIFLDNEMRVTNFTPAAADIFHLVETDVGRPIGHIKSRVSYDELGDDARRVIRTLVAVDREVEAPATRARYIVRILPYRSVDNFIGGAVVTFTDVTPVTRAEQARRESEERLRLVTEHIPQLVWTARHDGRWTWTSRQWTEFTGQSEEDSLDNGWRKVLHPEDQNIATTAWEHALASGFLDVEWRIRSRGGDYRWFHGRATPLALEDGGEIEWFGTSTDIHETRELRERQAVLVAELQHRTRNILGIVASLASRTIGRGGSAEDFEDRLTALSRAQALLSRFEGDTVDLGTLVQAELEAHVDAKPPKVTVDGPEVRLGTTHVQTFALALHELATNAVKYGALKEERGRLSVTWTTEVNETGGASLVLDWIESDLDLPAEADRRRGYGRELIEKALPFSLRAQTSYELGREGVRCRIRLPLGGRS